MVSISKSILEELQRKEEVDEEFLKELVQGLKDIKEGRTIRVR